MSTRIGVRVAEPGTDATALEELAGRLREELLALDVDAVARVSAGAAPPGTRGADLAAVGALVVTLQGSVALVEQLVRTVRSWLSRGPRTRSVELTVGGATLKLDAASREQQDELVAAFLHAVRTT